MQDKCKQTTPFLFWSQGAVVCQLFPSNPPCLVKGPSWLTNQVHIWATTNYSCHLWVTKRESHRQLAFLLWYRAVLWKRIFSLSFFFFSFHLGRFFLPSFLLILFSSSFNYRPSLNPSFSNLKGDFKGMRVHQMKLSKGSSGKNNRLFCPSSCQVIMSHVFDSIDRNT